MTSPPKPLGGISPNFTGVILGLSSLKLLKDYNSLQNYGCHDKKTKKRSSCQKLQAQFEYVMLGNYLQQTTSAEDNFRCIFFLAF